MYHLAISGPMQGGGREQMTQTYKGKKDKPTATKTEAQTEPPSTAMSVQLFLIKVC